MGLVVGDEVEKTVKEHLVDQVELLHPTLHLPDLDGHMVDLPPSEERETVVPNKCFTWSHKEGSITERGAALQDLLC